MVTTFPSTFRPDRSSALPSRQASAPSILVKALVKMALPEATFRLVLMLNATSSAVRSSPSDHFTPSLMVKV